MNLGKRLAWTIHLPLSHLYASYQGAMMTTGLVLLPGAGLGGWIWRDVRPLLESPSLAIDYERAGGVSAYAHSVLKQIEAWEEPRHVVLVCHSLGGVVGLKAASLLGDRLTGIVGVGAIVPAAGGSFMSATPAPQRFILGLLMRLMGTRPPNSAIRKGYGSDLSDTVTDEVLRRFVPETRAVYFEPTGADAPNVAASYIELTGDSQLPLSLQAKMADNLGASARAQINSAHLPMLSQPATLAAILNDFAQSAPV